MKLLPSVTSASLTETVPVSIEAHVRVSAEGDGGHETRTVIRHVVGKDYFDTTGIPLPTGRAFRQKMKPGRPRPSSSARNSRASSGRGGSAGPADRDWQR